MKDLMLNIEGFLDTTEGHMLILMLLAAAIGYIACWVSDLHEIRALHHKVTGLGMDNSLLRLDNAGKQVIIDVLDDELGRHQPQHVMHLDGFDDLFVDPTEPRPTVDEPVPFVTTSAAERYFEDRIAGALPADPSMLGFDEHVDRALRIVQDDER